ncbi:MAG: Cold shock protein [Candidatus Tokpelaia sp. JSC189]|nr:MAG: Cold shock protein [Candidatus Tokpelaia sp. JSC189]
MDTDLPCTDAHNTKFRKNTLDKITIRGREMAEANKKKIPYRNRTTLNS